MSFSHPLGKPANNPHLYFATGSVTISNGASLSGALDLEGLVPVSLLLPAGWDAANVTFQVSYDGSTYYNLKDVDGEVSYPAAVDTCISLNPATFVGARYLKVRSGTLSVAVNQTADRVITVVKRSV